MFYSKKDLKKRKDHPKVKRLESFLERNGFKLDNGKSKKAKKAIRIRHQYDNYKFSKENLNPNWA